MISDHFALKCSVVVAFMQLQCDIWKCEAGIIRSNNKRKVWPKRQMKDKAEVNERLKY